MHKHTCTSTCAGANTLTRTQPAEICTPAAVKVTVSNTEQNPSDEVDCRDPACVSVNLLTG